jgi:hypothetical protein
VNRASKYWQTNWELHVDLLENEGHGPAYKTVLSATALWLKPHGPYPFSVSKINQFLSLFIVAVFCLLIANTLTDKFVPTCKWEAFPTICVGITAGYIIALIWLGRIGDGKAAVTAKLRETEVTRYRNDND